MSSREDLVAAVLRLVVSSWKGTGKGNGDDITIEKEAASVAPGLQIAFFEELGL